MNNNDAKKNPHSPDICLIIPLYQFIHPFLHPFFLFLLSSSSSIRLVVWRLRFLQPERDLLHCWSQHQEAQRHQVAPLPRAQLLPAFHLHDGTTLRLLTRTPHLHDGTAPWLLEGTIHLHDGLALWPLTSPFHLHDCATLRLLKGPPHLHDGTALSFRTLQSSYGTILRLQTSTTGHCDTTRDTTNNVPSHLTTVQTTNTMVQFYYWPNSSVSLLPARILEPLPSHKMVSLCISSGLFT